MRIRRCKTSGIIPAEVHGHATLEAKLPESWFGYASLEFIVPGRTGHEIDLVMLDVIMPRLDGWRAHQQIRAISPDVRVILTSGYSASAIPEHALEERTSPVRAPTPPMLAKPYGPDGLLRTVRETLDRDRDGARRLQHDRVGRFALLEDHFSVAELLALHVRGDTRKVDFAAELGLEPALEAIGRGVADFMMHQQHVLTPLDRLIAAGEYLMRPRRAEKAGALETRAHALAQA